MNAAGPVPGYVSTTFGHVHYRVSGEGPALLLVHQSTLSADEYNRLVPLLDGDCRVIAIDLPGHGRSTPPDHELSVAEHTLAAIAVLDALEALPVAVFGHHAGAHIAISVALEQPDRVTRLILSGAGLYTEEERNAILTMPMSRDQPVDEDGAFLQHTWASFRRMSAANTSPATTFLPFLENLYSRTAPYDLHYASMRWHYAAALARCTTPTLFVKALEDTFAGDVDAACAAHANAELAEIENAGAWVCYEQPRALADIIRRFLAR